MDQRVKRLPAMQDTWVWSLGWEDPLEREKATHSSTLTWKTPWTEKPGRLQSIGLQSVRHDWETSLSLLCLGTLDQTIKLIYISEYFFYVCSLLKSTVTSAVRMVFLSLFQFSSAHFSLSVQSLITSPQGGDGLPVHHHLPEFTQTHVHRVGDAIKPSHPLSSPSPPAPNPSQHQSFPMSQLFIWDGQSIGVSALASVFPMNTQDWSPLGWTGWISL